MSSRVVSDDATKLAPSQVFHKIKHKVEQKIEHFRHHNKNRGEPLQSPSSDALLEKTSSAGSPVPKSTSAPAGAAEPDAIPAAPAAEAAAVEEAPPAPATPPTLAKMLYTLSGKFLNPLAGTDEDSPAPKAAEAIPEEEGGDDAKLLAAKEGEGAAEEQEPQEDEGEEVPSATPEKPSFFTWLVTCCGTRSASAKSVVKPEPEVLPEAKDP